MMTVFRPATPVTSRKTSRQRPREVSRDENDQQWSGLWDDEAGEQEQEQDFVAELPVRDSNGWVSVDRFLPVDESYRGQGQVYRDLSQATRVRVPSMMPSNRITRIFKSRSQYLPDRRGPNQAKDYRLGQLCKEMVKLETIYCQRLDELQEPYRPKIGKDQESLPSVIQVLLRSISTHFFQQFFSLSTCLLANLNRDPTPYGIAAAFLQNGDDLRSVYRSWQEIRPALALASRAIQDRREILVLPDEHVIAVQILLKGGSKAFPDHAKSNASDPLPRPHPDTLWARLSGATCTRPGGRVLATGRRHNGRCSEGVMVV